jgi:hypothetical protein
MDELKAFLSKLIADILKGSAVEEAGNTLPESAVESTLALYKDFWILPFSEQFGFLTCHAIFCRRVPNKS